MANKKAERIQAAAVTLLSYGPEIIALHKKGFNRREVSFRAGIHRPVPSRPFDVAKPVNKVYQVAKLLAALNEPPPPRPRYEGLTLEMKRSIAETLPQEVLEQILEDFYLPTGW
jgi:hypothetical protein